MKTKFLIIRGPLASGKTTIAKIIAEKTSGEYISIDDILEEPGVKEIEKEEGYISQKSFFNANSVAVERAKEVIEKEKLVIFDGNFYWKSQIEDLLLKLSLENIVFTLKASVETCIERDVSRGETHGAVTAQVVHKKTKSFNYGIEIDTEGKTAEELADIILEKLK